METNTGFKSDSFFSFFTARNLGKNLPEFILNLKINHSNMDKINK